MAGIFLASVLNLKERLRLIWSRPVWIQASKTKLQVGIIQVNVSKTDKFESYWAMPICLPPYFSSFSWSWSTSSSHLFHPDHCAWLAGNSNRIFFGIDDGNYCAPEQLHQSQPKFFEFHCTQKLHCNCMKASWTTSCSIMRMDLC
jgi:hypothetical protein